MIHSGVKGKFASRQHFQFYQRLRGSTLTILTLCLRLIMGELFFARVQICTPLPATVSRHFCSVARVNLHVWLKFLGATAHLFSLYSDTGRIKLAATPTVSTTISSQQQNSAVGDKSIRSYSSLWHHAPQYAHSYRRKGPGGRICKRWWIIFSDVTYPPKYLGRVEPSQ